MKKYLLCLSLFCIDLYADRQEVFGRSFMFTRPGYYHLSTHQALWHAIVHNKKGDLLGGFHVTTFFQKSIDQEKIARYFLINRKNELLVSGDQNEADQAIRDIRAEWLNLPSNFRGKLSLNPQQQQVGITVEYNQDLKKWFDVTFIRDWQLGIIIPFVVVNNDINLQQIDVVNPGINPEKPRDIIEAFKQTDWKFSRIVNERSRAGVAEIKLTLGTSYMSEDYHQINYYALLVIPAGKRQNPRFLFDPVVGNNRHPGIGGAAYFQFLLNRDPSNFALTFFLGLESILLIRNKQFRTFDLKNKPWSRFMLFNKKGAPPNQNIPGINLLTREVVVNPFNVIDFTAGWRLKTGRFEFELGYNIWGHGDERLKIRNVIEETFGIAGNQVDTTASRSTISNRAENDPEFVPISAFDFDLKSAQSGSALNHKVHMSGGVINTGKKIDSLIGAGWFIDLPQKNSAFKLWGVWVKLAATF